MAQSKDFPDAFYRVTIKGLVVRDGKILVIWDQGPTPNNWELPGGGMDFGETPQEGLKREVREEMNLEVAWVAEHPLYAWSVRREHKRNMDWFYVLVLAYPMELNYEDFKPTAGCGEIVFMTVDEMRAKEDSFAPQIRPFFDIFNPKDFA